MKHVLFITTKTNIEEVISENKIKSISELLNFSYSVIVYHGEFMDLIQSNLNSKTFVFTYDWINADKSYFSDLLAFNEFFCERLKDSIVIAPFVFSGGLHFPHLLFWCDLKISSVIVPKFSIEINEYNIYLFHVLFHLQKFINHPNKLLDILNYSTNVESQVFEIYSIQVCKYYIKNSEIFDSMTWTDRP